MKFSVNKCTQLGFFLGDCDEEEEGGDSLVKVVLLHQFLYSCPYIILVRHVLQPEHVTAGCILIRRRPRQDE